MPGRVRLVCIRDCGWTDWRADTDAPFELPFLCPACVTRELEAQPEPDEPHEDRRR